MYQADRTNETSTLSCFVLVPTALWLYVSPTRKGRRAEHVMYAQIELHKRAGKHLVSVGQNEAS